MAHLSEQLAAAGLAVFPCTLDKVPAISKGVDWRDAACQPVTSFDWRNKLVGIPIPPGAVIIDLDTYKGVTREQVDQALGFCLPWDAAMIQTTGQGGQHYAFRANWPAIQGSNIGKIKGLDIRAAGKGYICTGDGYASAGFGVHALVTPQSLIELPDCARPLMEDVAYTSSPAASTDEHDEGALRQALSFIDPGCGRREWVKIGLALRHHYHEDEDAGLVIFDAWSRGELWPDGCPSNYDGNVMMHQWGSFKAEGDTTIASLYFEAIQSGWTPPVGFDTASAFSVDGAPAVEFGVLVDRIQSMGGDPKQTTMLIDAVSSLACSPIQRATLLALLTRELKDVGLLTKAVRSQLDLAAGGTGAESPPGQYGKNQTQNALMFLDRRYPGDQLRRAEQVWYTYDQRIWHEVDDDMMMYLMSVEMLSTKPQHSTVVGTYKMLSALAHYGKTRIGDMPANLVIFQNGILDLNNPGTRIEHSPDYFTTNMLPYDYEPDAKCDAWIHFLREVFEDDDERIALLQEWFGYVMSSSYRHHKIMLLIGPGRSGKGTIGRIMEEVVGMQNFTAGSLHGFADDAFIESLRTKKAMFIGDAGKTVNRFLMPQIVERLKTISGNDAISFKRKFRTSLSERVPTRITIASNPLPALFDDSGVLASRLLVLPFEVSFLGRENLNLFEELMVELQGIAAWSLAGLSRLNANGRFTVPAASATETDYIAETYSPLREFVDDVCRLGTSTTTTCDRLYEAYKVWAALKQDADYMNRKRFIGSFKDLTRGRQCKYGPHRMDDGVTVTRGFKGLALNEMSAATAGAFKLQEVK